MIAQNCHMHPFLTATANTFWLETEKEPEDSHLLSLDEDVWARFMEF